MKMNYVRFGKGKKTMLLLPGLSLKPVCPSLDAIKQAYDLFARDYTVYLFDRREDIEEGYSLKQMALDTLKKVKELGLKDLYLYGVSQGGMIAQIMAIEEPSIIHKLALCSTCSRLKDTRVLEEWSRSALENDIPSLIENFAEKVYSPTFYEQYKEMIFSAYSDLSKQELRHFKILSEAIRDYDLCEMLQRVNIPTLVLGSRKDQIIPVEEMEETARLLKAKSYFYEGYSHAVYDEASDLKEKIYDFFQEGN